MFPVNLYYNKEGCTVLRYWRHDGKVLERVATSPAQLLTLPPDADAAVKARVLDTPAAVLFSAFRRLPLVPNADWQLGVGDFSPLYRETFAAMLRMLRLPSQQRWCVRGEPGWFLQFGLRETDGSYTMGAFVLPCGKPAVLTFRSEDLIEALPPKIAFETMTITSAADGLEEQTISRMAWDTRIRLPIADNGAALVRLFPEV